MKKIIILLALTFFAIPAYSQSASAVWEQMQRQANESYRQQRAQTLQQRTEDHRKWQQDRKEKETNAIVEQRVEEEVNKIIEQRIKTAENKEILELKMEIEKRDNYIKHLKQQLERTTRVNKTLQEMLSKR